LRATLGELESRRGKAHPDSAPPAWPNGGWCAVADPGMVREV